MGLEHEETSRASEEAAYWLHRLREDDTPQAHAEFSAWIKKAAVNVQEFLFAQAVWQELDHVDAQMRARLWSAEDGSSVLDFRGARSAAATARHAKDGVRRRPQRPRSWTIAIAAACAALAIGALLILGVTWGGSVYTTAIGDQKAIKLADGSVVHLNTHSRAEVRYGDHERVVRLVQGEALFVVEHDTSRPFYVLTDSARIRALGTQFNVYRSSTTETRVAVVDGAVQVSSPTNDAAPPAKLAAGDEANVAAGHIIKSASPDVQRAVAWRARRLMFPGDPVGVIVEEFNRYSRVPIRIEDATLRARRMSGVFDADDPGPLLQYLSRDPNVVIEKSDREIVIHSR